MSDGKDHELYIHRQTNNNDDDVYATAVGIMEVVGGKKN